MRYFRIKRWPGIVLGILFVVSGVVKAVDPIGLSYKTGEYLSMFQLSGWSGLSVIFAILLCTVEMTLGLLLLLRLWRRVTALAVMFFILGFTILTYLIYTDPYGGINECGCFGEAIHLSNGTTFAKNMVLLVVAGFHLWNVFRRKKNPFNYRQVGLTLGMLAVAFLVPLYSYFYLPPFDFLPYNVGTRIGAENTISFYDVDFNDFTEKVFTDDKPAYMVGLKQEITPMESRKLTALHKAYTKGKVNLFVATSQNGIRIPRYDDIPVYLMDGVALKSVLRTSAGVVAFTADRHIAGKWNLSYTPYRFDRRYGEELTWERWKRGMFFGMLLLVVALLFYGRKKLGE
ncbi:MAG: DoxX family membrane protein [Odoribacter sp.]